MKQLLKVAPVLIVLLIVAIGTFISSHLIRSSAKLKIFNPSEVSPLLVDSSLREVNRFHRISDFELINQEGKKVTQKDYEGKIYVADFFFTTCPSICPKMSGQLHRVYMRYANNDEVMLLSHTVMPETDSVPVLHEYAKKYKADPKKWIFATGDKKQIYALARRSYFAVKETIPEEIANEGDEHDFIHTENFILIDKNKRIRGYYDGTSEKEVDRLMDEMEVLLRE